MLLISKTDKDGHSYNGRPIENATRAVDWYQFRWPWV